MPFFYKFTTNPERIRVQQENYDAGMAYEKLSIDTRLKADVELGDCNAAHLAQIRAAAGYPLN